MKRQIGKSIFAALTALLVAAAVLAAGCSPKTARQDVQQTPPERSESESLSAKDMTVEEMLKHLTLDGVEVGLPCKVKDLPESIELREGYILSAHAAGELYYDNQRIGVVYFRDLYGEYKKIDNMKENYEDEVVYGFGLNEGVDCFELLGVTVNDNKQEVVNKLGKPDEQNDEAGQMAYVDSSGKRNRIDFYFHQDGSMYGLDIVTSIDM